MASASVTFSSHPTFHTDRYGLIHQARISASVNAMRILNTGTEVEAAVADALVGVEGPRVTWDCSFFRATLFISSESRKGVCCVQICVFILGGKRCLTVTRSIFVFFLLLIPLFIYITVGSEVGTMLLKVRLIGFREFPLGSLSHLCPLDCFFPVSAVRRLQE